MDGESRPSVHTQILGDVVRNAFRANEDKNFGVFSADLIQMLDQLGPFLKLAANADNLLDVVVGSELHGSDVTLDKILQEILKIKVKTGRRE
jgi:hypothetical protein